MTVNEILHLTDHFSHIEIFDEKKYILKNFRQWQSKHNLNSLKKRSFLLNRNARKSRKADNFHSFTKIKMRDDVDNKKCQEKLAFKLY